MRIFRRCPRRRVSRESARPSSCNAWRVRGTWLRRRRAPSAMPACVASRPGSATFQNPWRWTRTRSAAVRSTAFRCGPVYLSVRPLILTLSGDGNYREHFIYRRLGCEFIIRCPPGGHCMKVILREDEAGVSEVIGTILILAMTVVLFSSIIIWVSSIPVPTAQTRLDMESSMTPVYNAVGAEIAVNITIRHLGGERLQPLPTRIYVQSQRGNNPPTTDIVLLHPYNGALATPSGLLDGSDSNWDAGERWAYKSFTIKSSDAITVTVVDLTKSIVEWRSAINGATGARPPVFVEKWTDGVPSTSGTDPVNEHLGFALYAKVIDPDNDLNPNSVYATLSIWFGTGNACDQPQKMHDDGVGADRVASDGIFSYGATTCVNPPFPNLNWDGSIILLNATDMQGNAVTPGGTAAYPGTGAQTNFAFAVVVDINPSNPDGGGVPSELFLAAANPFASVSLPTLPALVSGNTNAGTYMVEIIVSGIAGPISMTYGQIITRWGATYNPYDHLNDADPTTRTQWYSQLIQFGLVTIY